MRVKDCTGCLYLERKTWSHECQPENYHKIGMTHAYAYCNVFGKRVSKVYRCAKSIMAGEKRRAYEQAET